MYFKDFVFWVEQLKGIHHFLQNKEFLSRVPFPPQMMDSKNLQYLRQTMIIILCFISLMKWMGKPSSWCCFMVKYFHTDTDLGVGKEERTSGFNMVFPACSCLFLMSLRLMLYRTFYPKTKGYTFFSAPHGTFSKIDHIIGQKTDLNRYKNIEIVQCILSDHHGLRLIFNNNINNGKPTYTWKLNNTILNDTLVKE